MKFLVDAQLPKHLAEWLLFKGLDTIHTLELPDQNKTDDDQIKAFAKKEDRVVISKDRDFLDSHILKNDPSKLIIVKTGNISNEDLLQIFKANLPVILELIANNNLVEVGTREIISHG